MDLATLKTLTLVAQHGSLAAVARLSGVDPSSISRQVAQAEATLGLRLFERSTRRLSVTEAGERYLTRIAPVLEEAERAREDALGLRQRPTGRLRITASVAFSQMVILPHLAAFQTAYPEITVDLMATDQTVDILANAVDLAIRLAPAPKGDLISTKLMTTRYRVVATPAYLSAHGTTATPADLASHACLRLDLPGYRDAWRFRDAGGAETEVPVTGRTLISNALILKDAAKRGFGPTLLADWLIGDDVANGTLIDLFPDHAVTATSFDTAAWALYPSRAYLPAKTRVALDFLRTALRS